MSDYTAKRIDEIEAVNGVFHRIRDELGVSSFGINVLDLPPNATKYPDHAESDQEEAYVPLSGAGEIDIQGERIAIDPSLIVRVGAGTRHKVWPGPDGMRLLVVGGIPGRPYEPPDLSKIEIDGDGAPEPDHTVKPIDEMEAIFGGGFKRARAELGLSSFGIQVLDLPPSYDAYPEHDHSKGGQEEVYVPISGSAEIEIDGEKVTLEPGVIVRVGPDPRRKIRTADSPARIIALGGVPGKAFEPGPLSELGGPDSLAS